MLESIREEVGRKLAKRVQLSGNGRGAAGGLCFETARRVLRGLQRGPDATQAALLATAVSGGRWPAQRVRACEPGAGVSGMCPRCNQEPEALFPRYWACPGNGEPSGKDVVESQSLAGRAAAGCPIF